MNESAEKPPRAGRKGVWGFRILALALPLLAVLLILEIVLRTFFPLYPVGILKAHAYDAELG